MLSELTPQFEMLIIDEGSADDTSEVAYELAQRYPQVNVTHCSDDHLNNLIDTMSKLNGDIVFLADRQVEPVAHELRELWNMRHNNQLVMARLPRGPENLSDDLITRLMGWGDALRQAGNSKSTSTLRMMRRSAMMKMSSRGSVAEMAY
jgi:glycosyltransferase involved in cell wall biosynthesis